MRDGTSVFYRDLSVRPPMILRGEGVRLYDEEGREYLDGNASAAVVGLGHGRTEIWQALHEAGTSVPFVYGVGFTHPWQEQLANSILSISPANMGGVYFVSGGSEANESAIKLSRQYHVERGKPQKYKFISRWQSFHGVTLATLALGGRTSWRSLYSPYLMSVCHIAPPYEYRCAMCLDRGSCSLACADELERAICLEGPETVAAFFAEPIVGTTVTGLVPAPDYYRRIREICDRYDVLFVADEVLSGYGRTGRHFAIDHWSVQPDIITTGKGIGSGYAPLGAMIVDARILDVLRKGSQRFNHGFTYSGTPSSCFVGTKVFEIMQREGLFTRPESIGRYLMKGLEKLAERHEVIGQIRGRGLLIGIEFVADRQTRQPFPRSIDFAARITRAMRRRGVVIGAGVPLSNFGKDGDHIQISPPFIIDEVDCDQIVDTLDQSVSEVIAEVQKDAAA